MGRKKVYAMIASLVAVAAVALLLGLVVIPGSSTGTLSTTVTASSGNPSEGVVVHGYWTIEVFNPDGSLAEHHEFENTFHAEGKQLLSLIFNRQLTLGRWSIKFSGSPTYPCQNEGSNDVCSICESNLPVSKGSIFKNLTVAGTGVGDGSKFVLSGSATIANSTNINAVSTVVEACLNGLSPFECASSSTVNQEYKMTYASVSPTIAVQAGQQVQITVEISFG